MNLDDIVRALATDEGQKIAKMAAAQVAHLAWIPNPGPQTAAYLTKADQTFYGGAAGGGKTELGLGLAFNEHRRSLILRREGTDLGAIIERLVSINGGSDGFNKVDKILRRNNRFIELGSCPHENDKYSYQGQPHDLKFFDELPQFTQSMFEYIIGWNRNLEDPRQRCRVVGAGNPPSTPEGMWVKQYWGPWLDPQHPNPAQPGELRYFANIKGEDTEVEKDWHTIVDGVKVGPRSRTFIPARTTDNPHLGADYMATLNGMPEPFRSQLLYGDMQAGVKDHPYQVIPTQWIDAAFDRWREREAIRAMGQSRRWVMTALGVDCAIGGADNAVCTPVYDNLNFGQQVEKPGKEIKNGSDLTMMVLTTHKDKARVMVDLGGGYGDQCHTQIQGKVGLPPIGCKGSASATGTSRRGYEFPNLRSQQIWAVREMLDPENPENEHAQVAIYPSEKLKRDLTAPTYQMRGNMIVVEPYEKLKERIGRSLDYGSSFILAANAPHTRVEEIEETREHFGDYGSKGPEARVSRSYARQKERLR